MPLFSLEFNFRIISTFFLYLESSKVAEDVCEFVRLCLFVCGVFRGFCDTVKGLLRVLVVCIRASFGGSISLCSFMQINKFFLLSKIKIKIDV